MKNTQQLHPIIIVNPVSGHSGTLTDRKTQITQLAKQAGWRGTILETTKEKHAGIIAEQAIKQGAKHIVICGGDGSIMEVLPTTIHQDITIGIVPLGTGNLFAKNLNLPTDIPEALQTALYGALRKIDVGKANDTFFTIIAGIGIDAEIMKQANRTLKNRYGFLAYLVTAIKNLGISHGKYRITVDKKQTKIMKAKTILIANMGKIQGGIEAVPDTHASDGTLHIGIIQAPHAFAWISLLFNSVKGNIDGSPHYTLLKGKHIEIISLRGKKRYQCDGDHFPPTEKLIIDIYPKALQVMR